MAPSTRVGLVVVAAATWVLMWLNLIVFCLRLSPGSPRATLVFVLLVGALALWVDAALRRRRARP